MAKSAASETANKRLARAFIEELLNRREMHRMPEFIAPECDVHGAPVKGIAYFEEHYRTLVHVYPDLQATVEGQVAEGDIVVTWYRATGTHAGELQGVRATHRQLHLNGVNIQRIRDGRIVEHWGGANTLEAFLEMGVIQWVKS